LSCEANNLQISDLFGQLKDDPSGHAYTVVPIPGHDDAYLGIDSASRPCFFVRAAEKSMGPPLRTTHVSLRLGQEYRVASPKGPARSARLHALICETADEADVETFIVLVEAFLSRYKKERIDEKVLTAFFGSMARLFSIGPSDDLRTERQGLWGELFLMSHVNGFVFWAPFWHSETTRKFDFSCRNKRVEVKSTVGTERVHQFSHRQIYELEGEEIMIASLLLRKDDAGLSLRKLIQEARAALQGTEHYFKLEQSVRQAGMETTEENGPSYDSREAEKELAWYRATEAPHFQIPEPPGVSQTHYRDDLSTAPKVGSEGLSGWLGQWTSPPLVPRSS
jgi:hypothetical protein